MKKIIVYIFSIVVLLFFAACKQEVPTMYNQTDGIYFNAGADSMYYTFAKYPNRTSDTIKIPVNVLGNASGVDREINVDIVNGNGINGVPGVHYKLLAPYKLPANSYSTLIPVVIYRTPDLDSTLINFSLKLTPNANFTTGITTKSNLKIKIAYLQKPPTWGDLAGSTGWWAGYSTNFGTWTKTKYKVILNALYDPISDTTVSEFPYNRFAAPANYLQYLQLVKNYIRTNYPGNYSTPVGVGPTLRDPDAANAVIQVGPANY